MTQLLSDKDMINDILCTEKELASSYNLRTLESANSNVHDAMMQILQEEHRAQYSVFGLMSRKNMYQVLMSNPQDISQVSTLVNQMQMQAQQRSAQIAQQQNQFNATQSQFGTSMSYGIQSSYNPASRTNQTSSQQGFNSLLNNTKLL